MKPLRIALCVLLLSGLGRAVSGGVVVTPNLVQSSEGWDEWEFHVTGFTAADAVRNANTVTSIDGLFRATPGGVLSFGRNTTNAFFGEENPLAPRSYANFSSSIQVSQLGTPAGVQRFEGTWYSTDRLQQIRPVNQANDQPELSLLARIFVTQGGGINFEGLVNTHASISLPLQFSAGRADPVPDDPSLLSYSASSEIFEYTGSSWPGIQRSYMFDATSFTISNAPAADGRMRDASLIRTKIWPSTEVSISGGLETGLLLPGEQKTAEVSYDETGLLYGAVMRTSVWIDHYDDRVTLGPDSQLQHVKHQYSFFKRAAGHPGSARASLVVAPDTSNPSPYAGISGISDQSTGTIAALLGGRVIQRSGQTTPRTVEMSWADRDAAQALPESAQRVAISDTLHLSGISMDGVAIQLSYDPTLIIGDEVGLALAGEIQFSAFDPATGDWTPASSLNSEHPEHIPTINHQGAWPGPLASYVENESTGGNLHNVLGSTGVDTENNVVWAILNYNGIFAVTVPRQFVTTAVPEPSTWALATIAGAFSFLLHWRRRKGH